MKAIDAIKENELCSFVCDGSGYDLTIIRKIIQDKFRNVKVADSQIGRLKWRVHVCIYPSTLDEAIFNHCRGIATHLTASREFKRRNA